MDAAGYTRDKRLDELDSTAKPNVPVATVYHLAGCGWVGAEPPPCLIGSKLVDEFFQAAGAKQLPKTIARADGLDFPVLCGPLRGPRRDHGSRADTRTFIRAVRGSRRGRCRRRRGTERGRRGRGMTP